MIEDFRDGSPAEYAAFYVLGQYITGDIKAAAIKLLESGYDGEYIASCVFDLPSELETDETCFEKALLETGLLRLPSHKESVWLALRFYLSKVIEDPEDASLGLVCKIINLERDWGWGKVELFPRPDCDTYFREQKKKFKYVGSKFGGQELGIENLISLYYSQDDWTYNKANTSLNYDEWFEDKRRQLIASLIAEAKRVRDKFYSLSSELPEDLRNVGEFL